ARGQKILFPDAHRQVFALQKLERGQDARRPDQAMVGMQMVPAQQERRELLRRSDRSRHTPCVYLASLDLVEHRDVDELRRRGLGEVAALTNETARGQPLER